MKNRLIYSIIMTLCATAAHSQTFLDSLRKQEPGKGTVSIIQSPEIDKLVNGSAQGNSERKAQEHTPPADSSHESAATTHESATTTTPAMEETVVDTRKKVMRNSYKTQGYRIQVFSGGNSRKDRQKAETAGAVIKNNFPSEPVYVHFYSPSWKCRMGNYKTLEEARRLLAQVKKLGYTQACIVKGTISVQY